MKRRQLVTLVTSIAALSAVAIALPVTHAFSRDRDVGSVSRGPVTVTPEMNAVLKRTRTDDGTLLRLGNSHDATFYRIADTGEHGDCFGVGLGEGSSATINLITCGRTPSAEEPVVDSSIFDTTDSKTTYNQLIGWSSSSVRTMVVSNSLGREVASVVPRGGFYYLPRSAMPADAVRLDALDSEGKVIWSGSAE